MRARILRLIVIVWLAASPLNATPDSLPKNSGAASAPIEWYRPFVLHLPVRPLSTVVDFNGASVSGARLSSFITPSTRGTLSATDTNGRNTRSWAAGSAIDSATIETGEGAVSGKASINLTAGTLTTVTVVPSTTTVTVGLTTTFTAYGVDQIGNAVTITPTWNSNAGSIDSTGVFTAQTRIANGRFVTATADAISGTATINVIAGPLVSIVVSPSPANVAAGTTRSFTANGFDQYGNSVPITPLWTTDCGTINSSGVFTAQTRVAAGRRITATQGITAGVALINLLPGAPYTLTLQPPTAVISAGQGIAYTAIATDTFGNPIGNVTSSTKFSIAPASGGSFAANVVTPTINNTWIVTGVNDPAVSAATVAVTVAAFNHVRIEDAPAGSGAAVQAVTLNVANSLSVYAAAYDVYNNFIGPHSVTWGGTGIVTGNLAPTTEISTTFTPVVSGTGTITATSGGVTATTGSITVQSPVLNISKTASPDPLTPGNLLQYTILFTNTGDAPAQNVIITETYPLSTTILKAVPAPTSGTNVWSIGSLAVNDERSIAVFLTTASQMPVGSVLTNSVRMSAVNVPSAIFTATTPVNALPNLSASIIDSPDPSRPGDLLSYIIQYRNTGTAPVTNVRVTETYPSYVSFVSADPPPDIDHNVWLTNTLSAVGDNSRTIVVTVRIGIPLTDTTILNNQVVVSAQEAPPYTTTQQTLIVAPELQVSMLAHPLTPEANGPLTYTLSYTNSGSSYASNTTITDALPANTSFVQCQPSGCRVPGGIVTWDLGQLGQLTSDAVTLTVQVANNLVNGTIITNRARIISTDQVSAAAQLTSTVVSAPELTLSKSDGITDIAAGQLTTYTLSFANMGTAPAANVVITDRIPDYTKFVGCSSCVAAGGGVYSFTLGTLNAGQNGEITVSLRVSPTLPAGLRAITNTAAIATSTSGDGPANNVAQDVNAISTQPSLALSINYDSSSPYPGKVITYTLRYTNTSDMDTIGVAITATRPAWLASAPPGWIQNGAIDVRSIGNLAARQSGSVTYVLTLPATYTPDMNAFILTFFIQDGGPGGLPIAQAQSTSFIGVPDLSIAQVIVPASVVPNQSFTATVVISNNGLGKACNPKNCSGFYVDAFIDPPVRPLSASFIPNSHYVGISPLGAGLTATVFITNLYFTPTQQQWLYFKVDNFDCSIPDDPCLPSHSSGGLVPEYDEGNNVFPANDPIVVPRFVVYLPLVRKYRP